MCLTEPNINRQPLTHDKPLKTLYYVGLITHDLTINQTLPICKGIEVQLPCFEEPAKTF